MNNEQMEWKELKTFLDSNGIPVDEKQLTQLDRFSTLLLEKNKVMNLTAIEDPKVMEIRHFIDSLEAVPLIMKLAGDEFRLIDVGCGGGFPGVPLKIFFPDAQFTLMDSLAKKIGFIHKVIEELELPKAEAIAARAEELARTDARESYDICVSRAVASMNVLLEYCLPFVRVGGLCILYKSGQFEQELEEAGPALEILGGELAETVTFELPADQGSRSLVILKKIKETPAKYPRRPGKPSKSPIK